MARCHISNVMEGQIKEVKMMCSIFEHDHKEKIIADSHLDVRSFCFDGSFISFSAVLVELFSYFDEFKAIGYSTRVSEEDVTSYKEKSATLISFWSEYLWKDDFTPALHVFCHHMVEWLVSSVTPGQLLMESVEHKHQTIKVDVASLHSKTRKVVQWNAADTVLRSQ